MCKLGHVEMAWMNADDGWWEKGEEEESWRCAGEVDVLLDV